MKTKYIYFTLPISVALIALILDYVTDSFGTLIPNAEQYMTAQYLCGIVVVLCSLVSVWGAFTFLKEKKVMKLSMLSVSALLVILEHYAFYDTNFMYFLPMLVLIYLVQWKSCVR